MIYLKTSVGIELRGEDMLIASLQSNLTGEVFTHFRSFANYRQRDRHELRREIALFFKTSGLGKENIILGIARKDIVIRYLDLPSEVADNLKQAIRYQVQSFEPSDEDRFYYDYAVLDGNIPSKRLSILLTMVKKSILDGHLQLLLDLGIRPKLVTGTPIALSNLFLANRKDVRDKNFILALLSPSSLELLALRRGCLAYSTGVPKRNNQGWADLLLRELNEAASKMRLDPEETLEKIVLAGEAAESAPAELAAAIPDCELIQDHIAVRIPNQNIPHVQEAACALGLAYTGLVRCPWIKINLLPEELRTHQTRWVYVPTAISGLAILVLALALAFHDRFQNRELIRKLDQEIQLLKEPVERVQALRNQSEEMEKRILAIENRLRNRDMNLEILKELTTILPADTYLMTYTYREGIIQLAGVSSSAPNLIGLLEKSPLLKDVSQKGGIFKDAQTGKDRFSFEAKLER